MAAPQATTRQVGELWMELKDRHLLIYLMNHEGISQRQLCREIGWQAHSYMSRLVRGDRKTLDPEPALRIAEFFGVDPSRLFVTKVSRKNGHAKSQMGRAA